MCVGSAVPRTLPLHAYPLHPDRPKHNRMDIERRRRSFALLRAALDAPPERRAALIAEGCAGDTALAADVDALLAAETGSLLDRTAIGIAARLALDEASQRMPEGAMLGDWRIVRSIGEGGMGTVYLAERAGDGYRQQGALKLIKRGMDSVDLLARFRRERRILSQLSHAAIARLLDGGIADDGRPFLVMEYVDGETLDLWVERVHPDHARRLNLFLRLCDAVAHAHHQLIVHRDIKPSNVLVDASDQPRLLDFGIAKVLEDTDQPERTATAARVLSRAYAAPEQRSDGHITTATDVYQLGVLLFELFSGTRFDGRDRALSSRGEHATSSGPPKGVTGLRGDLAVIAARASDADPLRRYATVEALADDLIRWRDGLPIRARNNSAAYRMRRFVARNRAGSIAASFAIAAIVTGFGAAIWQADRANGEALAAREHARTADRIRHFMVGLFSASDPQIARGEMPRADELLDAGAARVAIELRDEPRVQAQLYEAMASSYAGLNRFDAGAGLIDRAIAALPATPANQDLLGPLHRQGAGMHAELGHYAVALQHLDAARGMVDAADPTGHVDARTTRGWVLRDLGRLDESEQELRAALATLAPAGSDLSAQSARALNNLAFTLQLAGKREESDAAYTRLIAWTDAHLAADDPQRLWAEWSRARALREFGFPAQARERLLAIRPLMLKVEGADHSDLAGLDIVLGQAEMDLGDLREGHARIVDAVARSHRASRHNALWAQAEFSLADADWRMSALGDAALHFAAAREGWIELVGNDHPAVRDCDSYLAAIEVQLDPASGARQRLRELAQARKRRGEPGFALTASLLAALPAPAPDPAKE